MGDRRLPSSSSEDDSSQESWIEWFCRQEGNDFFCEVDRRYIEDTFNLYGIREVIGTQFRRCLDVILDRSDAEGGIEKHIQDLYGLIHARFIVTKRGQDKMINKMKNREFGVCPRLSCQQCSVLPVGLRDHIDLHEVLVYCPRCNELMLPCVKTGGHYADDLDLDGAYFGTTFPHLLLMQYPDLKPSPPKPLPNYVPKVFGFKVRRQIQDQDSEEQG